MLAGVKEIPAGSGDIVSKGHARTISIVLISCEGVGIQLRIS